MISNTELTIPEPDDDEDKKSLPTDCRGIQGK